MGVRCTMADGGYEDKAAWEKRYQANGNLFEWYAPYDFIKERVEKTGMTSASKILVLGCGTSGLSASIFDSGCKNVVSVDFSETCIGLQTKRNDERVGMKFEVGDARKLNYGTDEFDVIIAKGTVDAILCSDRANANIKAAMDECARVLKPSGTFLVLSHAGPDERLNYFDSKNWNVTHEKFVRPSITEVEGLPADNPDNQLFQYLLKPAA